jgi:hypothetical protein
VTIDRKKKVISFGIMPTGRLSWQSRQEKPQQREKRYEKVMLETASRGSFFGYFDCCPIFSYGDFEQ